MTGETQGGGLQREKKEVETDTTLLRDRGRSTKDHIGTGTRDRTIINLANIRKETKILSRVW
jgi:hypothetical protein